MPKLVDVVIASFNQPLFLIRCIQSLRQQNRLGDIIVIDDGSNEETKVATKNLEGIRAYFNDGNSGWIKSIDRGVKKSTAPYVLILNSDTEATSPNTLEAMANNLDDGAAVCGALLLYPQNHPYPQLRGRVQHCGIYFEADSFPTHFMAQSHPQNPAVNTWRSVNAVTGAAMMVRREIWDKVGGFDPKFGNGVFEDCSLCLSVKALKQEVIYEPRAIWYHWEHASQPSNGGWFARENIERNLSYLYLRHGRPACDIGLYCKIR